RDARPARPPRRDPRPQGRQLPPPRQRPRLPPPHHNRRKRLTNHSRDRAAGPQTAVQRLDLEPRPPQTPRTRPKGRLGATRLAALPAAQDRKSTRLNSSHRTISYAVFCLKKKKKKKKKEERKKEKV